MKKLIFLTALLASQFTLANNIQTLSVQSDGVQLQAETSLQGSSAIVKVAVPANTNIRGTGKALRIPIVVVPGKGQTISIKSIELEGSATANKANATYKMAYSLGFVGISRELGISEETTLGATTGTPESAKSKVQAKEDNNLGTRCATKPEEEGQPKTIELLVAVRSNGLQSLEPKNLKIELVSQPCK